MTSTDLKAYFGIIERMKGLLHTAEFEQTFASLTTGLPKSKQFLLKMELKRLAQPCNYYIDLRGHVDGEVKPYEFRGKTHYLDDKARQIFEDGVAAYGQYTLGVYEEVMNADNNFRVRHRKETEERIRTTLDSLRRGPSLPEESTASQPELTDALEQHQPNKIVQFGSYISRSEERMNFGIEVEVRTTTERFSAITSDLSVSGCKLKVPVDKVAEPGDVINLALKGLEKEFTLNLSEGLNYEVVGKEIQDRYAYLRLKRLAPEQHPQFNQFLQNFINGNKRRYKVNLDNATDTVITKGYEQYYLPRINSLPVYLDIRDGQIASRFCLTSDYNKSSWHYFLDEQQQSVLSHLLSARRLKHLLNRPLTERTDILYCFTHAAKGKLYFYAALSSELAAEPALRAMFFGFGAGKPSWRIFHLSLLKTNALHSQNEFALPGAQSAQQTSPLLRGMLEPICYIAVLTDISAPEQRHCYTGHLYEVSELVTLNKFGLSKAAPSTLCEAIPIHYVNLRAESRYLYKTSVLIRTTQDSTPLAAFSRDFSAGGLQLEVAQPVNLQKGDVVLLDLPDLQKITLKHQLSRLPYEVMAVSKSRTIMNLKIAKADYHEGKQFFLQLIQSNRNKLTIAEETPKYPGLSDALRNMYLKALTNVVIFVHRKGLRHDINVLGQGAQPNPLHSLLLLAQEEQNNLSFELLTKAHTLNYELANQLKQMKRQDPPKAFELYIRVAMVDGRRQFSSYFNFEFATADELKLFAVDTLAQHTLFAFRFFLTRTGKLDSEYIAKELGYISVYAIHKAKSLEEELWHVEGVADGVEISTEFVNRFDPTRSQTQQQQRQTILQAATALTS
jgi:hypothetical protein